MKARVLLVDDDPGAIHVMHRILGRDHELRYALSGADALAIARDWRPDLVLLDAQMPGMSGTDVCRALKADPLLAPTPVVFVTALGQSGVELMALELGAAGHLSKPLDEATLLATVRRQLDGAPPPATRVSSTAESATGDPCILIVDDDVASVQAIHSALGQLQARFYFATTGAQALEMAARHRPDLVLLDIYMPGMDGLDVLRRLKEQPELADTQVIIVTRYAFPAMEEHALEAGGVDFIAKPYTQAVLRARVRNVLRLRERTDAAVQAEREHWQRISDSRLARVVGAASDAILTADAQGRVVLINAAACALFGVDAAFTIGRPLAQLLPGALPDDDQRLHRQRLELAGAGGRRFPAELSFSRLGQGDDRLTTVVLRDLSEQVRAESAARAQLQAEAALRAKSLMLSYLAHEIGNPINAVVGLSYVMLTDPADPLSPGQQQRLNLVADAGAHLRTLMQDVLDVERLESGRFDIQLAELDAARVARRALDAVALDAQRADVALQLDAGTAPVLRGDDTRLHQCLLNLLSNAVKFNRAGGHVWLRVRGDGARVAFEVEDDGPGLSAEQQKHLFEPFNRLGRGSQVAGAGIGLVLTRLLAGAMNGRLTVRGESGRGCCFTLELPQAGA
ncbi:MAG: response regulator [Rubrivivax sp.]